MAAKKRAIEILLTGNMSRTLPGAFGKAQGLLQKYNRMLGRTGIAQQRMQKSATSLGRSMGGGMAGSLLRSTLGYAAAYMGARQLADGIKGCIAASQQQQFEDTRLQTLMMNVNGATLKQVAGLKRYASQLQLVTPIGDEVTERGMSQLATFQLQAASIKKLTPALQDLAVGQYGVNVSGDQMQQTANLVGKVFTGQVGALKRVGISFDKQQEKLLKNGTQSQKLATMIEVVNQNYGGLARKMANNPQGRIKQFANAWGDVKEKIGGALGPLLATGLKYLSRILPLVSKYADILAGKIKGVGALSGPLKGIGRSLMRIFGPIVTVIVTKVWPLIKKVVGDVVSIFRQAWPSIQPALQSLGQAIGGLLKAIVPVVKWLWSSVLRPVLGFVVKTILPAAISLIAKVVGWVTGLVDKLKGAFDWFSKIWGVVKNVAKLLFQNSAIGLLMRAGSAITAKVSGKRAGGGPVSAGRSYLVGERGPELFTPRLNGLISANAAAAGGAMSVTFAPVINISGNADRREVQAGVSAGFDEFKRMFARLMMEQKRAEF